MQELHREAEHRRRGGAATPPLDIPAAALSSAADASPRHSRAEAEEEGARTTANLDEMLDFYPEPFAAAAAAAASPPTPAPKAMSQRSSSTEGMECWICFDGTATPHNPIVTQRCRCRGSVGFVHQKCIDSWVIHQRNRACQSCGQTYRLVHSEYPPGASLPLEPRERREFLLKFLVKPLLPELSETICCVLLRFVLLPLVFGLVYSMDRLSLLWWLMTSEPGTRTASGGWERPSPALQTPRPSAGFGEPSGTATAAAAPPPPSPPCYTTALLAWADTLIFGFFLCLVMNAVVMGWRKWNHYFRSARKRLLREVARREEEDRARLAAPPPPPPRSLFDTVYPDFGFDQDWGAGAPAYDDGAAAWEDYNADYLRDDHRYTDDAEEDGEDGGDGEGEEVVEEGEYDYEDEMRLAAAVGAARPPMPPLPLPEPDRFHMPYFAQPLDDPGLAAAIEGLEGWRPEWGPVPTDLHDLLLQGAAHRLEQHRQLRPLIPPLDPDRDATHGDADDGLSSDSDSDAASQGESELAYRLSFVDELFDTVEWLRSGAGGGGFRHVLPSVLRQLGCGLVLTLLLRSFWGRVALAVALFGFIAGWRLFHTRQVLAVPKRRFVEVAERVPLLAQDAVRTLFGVYFVDALFFYGALPELGGMVLHYALAPYMDIGFDRGFVAFAQGLTVFKVAIYWVLGAMLVMLLTAVELTVISPLFSNGVELFFVRSYDARWDTVLGYWRCVVTQVFDSEPLRVLRGFLRVAAVELIVLFIFFRMPFWAMLGCRNLIWGDGAPLETGRPLKMPLSLGMAIGYDVNADASYDEWRRTEVLRVLVERVLLPFGVAYAARVRELVAPMFDKRLVASIDPLVLAAVSSTSLTPAARELWEEVWGNMSDRAVFLFHLIDPESARRVAGAAEGFRETLDRVQEPMEWLRAATMEDGLCNTLMALSSPGEWVEKPQRQLPVINLDGVVAPAFIAQAPQTLSTARSHQMVLDAWRRSYQEAASHITHVLRPEALPSMPNFYPEQDTVREEPHTVNAAKCYIAAMQLSYPYLRMGRWRAVAYEWWSMLLLRNSFVNYGVCVLLYTAAFGTALWCFAIFPLQRTQLRLLLPVVRWLGHTVTGMEDYLFDAEQLRAVEGFIEHDGEDELVQPPMADPLGFDRREEYMDPSAIPSHLMLRRIVVAVLFFVVSSVMLWAVPVFWGTVLLCVTTNAITVVLGAICLSFLCWNPSLFSRAVVFGMALTLAVVFLLLILVIAYVRPFVELLWQSYPTLVEETFERHYDVHQMVGPYTAAPTQPGPSSRQRGGYGSDWESVDSDDAAGDAGVGGNGARPGAGREAPEALPVG